MLYNGVPMNLHAAETCRMWHVGEVYGCASGEGQALEGTASVTTSPLVTFVLWCAMMCFLYMAWSPRNESRG